MMAKKKIATTPTSLRARGSAKFKKIKAKEDELFAILGRYVQEFEKIVSTMRNDCANIVVGKERGIKIEGGVAKIAHEAICSLAFHHRTMSAEPISDLWCGLVYEQTRADVNLAQEAKEVIFGVSRTITSDFKKIIEMRNQLLHASWSIGPWYNPETFEFQFSVEKFKTGQTGLITKNDKLPETSAELTGLWLDVRNLKNRLSNFNSLRRHGVQHLVKSYVKMEKRWEERKA